ncbi:MAG: PTS transporter subunit EIIC [Lachnospiraceae bacterium]|nr:PTS transporter subunit EIIC [Lachnospiraceae bacterium]
MKNTVIRKLSFVARTVKASLAMVIPILFIGSITVMLNGFPIQAYQDFLDSFLGGALRVIIQLIQVSTVGILAIYTTVAINVGYMNQTEEGERLVFRFGSLLGCLAGFFIIVGFFTGEPDRSLLSGQGLFSALLAGIIGSMLYLRFARFFNTRKDIFVDGADSEFNAALHVILPFLGVTLCFASVNYLITVIFHTESIQHLFMNAMDALFMKMHRSYSSGLLFTVMISFMWWFGIHGNNVLNQVSEDMFTAILPGEIVSKSFIDTFVIMGGTGCVIGLLIAMLLFGKRSSTRKLFRMAAIPCIFNISELMVFGFPVIYNPMMIIPFILSPALCFSNAYLMTKIGFMPQVTSSVIWTTPALLSGYLATGSVRGIIVQVMNIIISVACYSPFLIAYEKRSLEEFSQTMDELVGMIKESEDVNEKVILTECSGNVGRLTKFLINDLETALDASSFELSSENVENPLLIEYKMKYDNEGRITGAESLLRWDHKRYGMVYPPLIVHLAKESGDIYRLETYIMERSIGESSEMRKKYGNDFRMYVDVTISTLFDDRFLPFLQVMADRYMLRSGNICLNIDEETELIPTKATGELIRRIRSFGYVFASDEQ